MPDEKTSSSYTTLLLNDSFPPQIDGVANAISNYAREIEEKHGHAAVLTPEFPEANDSIFPFPVYRYPSIDIRKKVGPVYTEADRRDEAVQHRDHPQPLPGGVPGARADDPDSRRRTARHDLPYQVRL